jgi:hypothetical protein
MLFLYAGGGGPPGPCIKETPGEFEYMTDWGRSKIAGVRGGGKGVGSSFLRLWSRYNLYAMYTITSTQATDASGTIMAILLEPW